MRSFVAERPWLVERVCASAAELHAWEPPSATRIARWSEVAAPALVLGSAQRPTTIDLEACARLGVEVVRRRSGGGAVLTWPGELLWLDVVVPAGDPLWVDDIGRSMWWFGDMWAAALEACGVEAADVHRGPLVRSAWSSTVCFEGLGPGEVTVGGHKAVGISQRRTRHWARLQAAVHLRWRSELLTMLVAGVASEGIDLRPPFCLAADQVEAVRDEIERRLVER
jgi:lipoate-protein ligase A